MDRVRPCWTGLRGLYGGFHHERSTGMRLSPSWELHSGWTRCTMGNAAHVGLLPLPVGSPCWTATCCRGPCMLDCVPPLGCPSRTVPNPGGLPTPPPNGPLTIGFAQPRRATHVAPCVTHPTGPPMMDYTLPWSAAHFDHAPHHWAAHYGLHPAMVGCPTWTAPRPGGQPILDCAPPWYAAHDGPHPAPVGWPAWTPHCPRWAADVGLRSTPAGCPRWTVPLPGGLPMMDCALRWLAALVGPPLALVVCP